MARYILLQVADNEVADRFVQALGMDGALFFGTPAAETIDDGEQVVHEGDLVFTDVKPEQVSVRAVFMKPTKFCECPSPGDRSVRGVKWGLWVHKDCGRVKAGNWQHPRNLLDPSDKKTKDREVYLGIIEPEGSRPRPYKEDWK